MTSKQPLQVAIQDFGGLKLPRLGRKKRIKHSKNPYKVKQILIKDDDQRPKKRLDGFLLLKVTKNDLPHEIIKADLSKMNIVETVVEDTKYFINLSHLDLSENSIRLEDLIHFQSLVDLKLCFNKIEMVNLNPDLPFQNMSVLDLSYNYIVPSAISSLQTIPNLKQLSLENNELRSLPEDLSGFQNLEEFNLNSNLFQSDAAASSFWYALAHIKKLKKLFISRNRMRGIHTEKLIAGNFMNLEILDFSFNLVENQHNLICARNFKKLEKLIVTGNPIEEYKGLEMEVYARTGAEVVNEAVEKPHLKKDKTKDKVRIQYSNLRTVENDNFGKDRNYFMGIEMPQNVNIQEDQNREEEEEQYNEGDRELESEINEKFINKQMEMSDDEEEEEQEENQESHAMFMTENPEQNAERKQNQKKQQQQQQEYYNDEEQDLEEEDEDYQEGLYYQNSQEQYQNSQQNYEGQVTQIHNSMSHDEIMRALSQNFGDIKEYDQHYDYATAQKTLNNVIKRPDDFQYKDNEQPHYMQGTKTQKRYKARDGGSSLVGADSFLKMDSKGSISKLKNKSQNSIQGNEYQDSQDQSNGHIFN